MSDSSTPSWKGEEGRGDMVERVQKKALFMSINDRFVPLPTDLAEPRTRSELSALVPKCMSIKGQGLGRQFYAIQSGPMNPRPAAPGENNQVIHLKSFCLVLAALHETGEVSGRYRYLQISHSKVVTLTISFIQRTFASSF